MARGVITVKILGQAKAALDALGEVEGRVKDFGSNVGKLAAAGAAAAGAAIGAALVKGTLDAVDQQAVADKLGSSLGLSDEEAERLGGVAGDIYANAYGESFADVADVLRTAVQVGVADSDLETITGQAFSLEQAFGGVAGEYLTLAGQLQNQGLTDSVQEGLDLLTTSLQQLPAEMQGPLTEAVAEYGTFLEGLGFSTEETFGFLTQAAADGEFALDKAGDAIKEFGIRSTDMSTASQEAYELIGLDAEAMANSVLAGGDVASGAFDQIIDGLLGIEDPAEQANAAIALFGTPLEDLGVDKIPEFLGSMDDMAGGMGDVAGASAELDAQLNDNLGTRIETLKRQAFQGLADFAERYVIPALERMVPYIERLAAWLGTNLPAAIETVRPIFEQVITFISENLPGAIVVAQEAFSALMEHVGPIIESLSNIITDMVVIISALWAEFGDEILQVVEIAWGTISAVIQGALKVIEGIVAVFAGVLTGDWSKAWDGVKLILSGALDVVKALVSGAFDAVVLVIAGIGSRIKSAASGMFDGIKDAFRSAINFIIDKWNGLSLSMPSVDLGPLGKVGGFSLDTPNIQKFHSGGVVPGRFGEEVFAVLQAGETVRTREQEAAIGGRGVHIENFYAADRPLLEELAELEARYGVLV